MSDKIMAADDFMTDEKNTDSAVRAAPFKFEKLFKRLLFVCLLLLAGELLWLFLINPALPLSGINISGTDILDRRTILNEAGITERTSYLSFNASDAKAALEMIPQIESAEIIKKFPDTVNINLIKRKPTAVSLSDTAGRASIIVYDKNGVVFEISNVDATVTNKGLPIISGMVFENARLGMRLPSFLLPLLNDIHELGEKSPELLSVISEIRINKKTQNAYDLILWTAYSPVKIKLGSELKENDLSYMLLLLDVLKEKGIDVDYIDYRDYRSGTASYLPKRSAS
jgi:cell division septal protein FtsQ